MRASLAIACLLAACDDSGAGGEDFYTEEGECAPPSGASDLAPAASELFQPSCFTDTFTELTVVESDADWQALFSCDTAPPDGVDLAAERAAVVSIHCSPTHFRFAAETASEVVVGVKTGISGACLGDLIVVPLPRSTKPIRLARCWDECHGECPPVP